MSFLHETREKLIEVIQNSLVQVLEKREIEPEGALERVKIEEPKHREHGDFACNIAMAIAKELKASPREIAQEIIDNLSAEKAREAMIDRLEVAGPGFINIYLQKDWLKKILPAIAEEKENYGSINKGHGKKVQVEFVSANPTGPLHVGHSRGAVVGDVLGNILKFCGCDVEKEFYINNSGHQMELLGRSIYLRLQEEQGEEIDFPEDGYQGEYIRELARQILCKYGDGLELHSPREREALCREFGYQKLMGGIKDDLKKMGIYFDNWFSERSLYEDGLVEKAIALLRRRKFLYEEDGATWFASSKFGDEKDRVVIKSDGSYTYFAADIAYHLDKLKRGYDLIIDVLGADHHGHIARMKAAVEAFGYSPETLEILIVQIVTLWRGEEKVPMSKRAGEFVTMRDVVDEVGVDAARYFYLMRGPESHMDFDLELAREQSAKNPVYYLQYAHARMMSLFGKAEERGISTPGPGEADLAPLGEEEESLLRVLVRFPDVVEESYDNLSPHFLTVYGHDLAQAFHAFYNKCPILTAEPEVQQARLALVSGAHRVLRNLLKILGIYAPDQM